MAITEIQNITEQCGEELQKRIAAINIEFTRLYKAYQDASDKKHRIFVDLLNATAAIQIPQSTPGVLFKSPVISFSKQQIHFDFKDIFSIERSFDTTKSSEWKLDVEIDSVSLTMRKSVMVYRGVTQIGQRNVYVQLKANVSLTPKHLQAIQDEIDSALKSLSCQYKDHFNNEEIKTLSGRTPLEAECVPLNTAKLEHVLIANDLMKSELSRRSSFVFWPLQSITSVRDLVEAGFYSADSVSQIVECFSCGLSLRISDLDGRHPLVVHRERSSHCQFLQSENIRDRTFNNPRLQSFERVMVNDIDVDINRDQNSHFQSPISGIKERCRLPSDNNITNRDLGRGKRRNITENHVEEISEKIQNISVNPCISQPSDEVDHGTQIKRELGAKLLLSGTSQNPRNLTDLHSSYGHRGDSGFSQQDRANNGGPLNEEVEGATAAISTFVPSPTEDSSAPPPRNILYEQDTARRESFNAWNGRHDIDSLVDAGLFYTGDQDIVRCFHCDIGLAEWNREDDPWLEHARHSHECHFLIRMKGQAYVDDVQREWAKVYSPKRPDLSHIDRRRETFHSWPSDFVVQTPDQLATAGFYYSGVTDTVRCHYCDGGLREWEPGDIPWVEHAKWFPHCKFVLKIKGLPFIQQCVARRNEVVEDTVPDNAREQNEALNRFRAPISSEEKYRAQEENNPLRTAAAEAILAMGYTTAVVSKCINAYIANTGHKNFGASDLMKIILDKEDEGGNMSSDGETGENETEFRYEGAALVKINETLKQEQLCIECRQRGRKILFQPCGHFLLCNICAHKYTQCVRCDREITSRANLFMS